MGSTGEKPANAPARKGDAANVSITTEEPQDTDRSTVDPPRTPLVTNRPAFLYPLSPPRTPLVSLKQRHPRELVPEMPEADPVEATANLIHQALLQKSLAYFAAEMISGPAEAPYNGKFLVGQYHEEWDELISKHENLVILAARDHGKCPVKGTLVAAADGALVPVEEWKGGDLIGYDESTFSLVRARSTPSRCVGIEPCLKITTRTGRTETVNISHRFATIDGWVPAKDLQIGDRIGCPKTLPVEGNAKLQKGEAWLLGLIVGDGGVTSSVVLTAHDRAIALAAGEVCNGLGWNLTSLKKNGVYGISGGYKKTGGPRPWLRKHGVFGVGSYEKKVPSEIFLAPNSDIAEFIAGWVDADGNINKHGGGCIEIYTVSERLARQGMHLLTRLGVVSVLSSKLGKYNGEDHWSWRLTIRGKSIVRFASHVHLRGAKAKRLENLARLQAAKAKGGSIDLLPKAVVNWLEHGSAWTRKHGGPGFYGHYDMTREKAGRIAEVQGNPRLASLAKSEVLWDEVVGVEPAGDREIYAIQVPGLKSYVAGDLINHNSHFVSLAYPIWRAGYTHPGKLGYLFSSTQEMAESFLLIIKEECCKNPKLRHLVPKGTDDPAKWGKAKEIEFSNGSKIRARGTGVRVRGGHPYWAIADDILDDNDIYSETTRNKHTDYFLSAILNMVVPGGQLLVVGTPFHELDLYSHLKETGVFHCVTYPAIKDDGTVLFPERYSVERLEQKKKALKSPSRFAREFLCRPQSDEASLFPSSLFEGPARVPYVLGLGYEFWEARGCELYTGVDFAMSASAGGDYTVIFTVAKDRYGVRWIANIRRGKGWGFQRQLDEIKEEFAIMRPCVIHAEANQMQRIFTDELLRETDIPIRKFFTAGVQPRQPWRKGMSQLTLSKNHLEKGVPSLRMSLENGKWRIPRGDERSIEMTDIWMGELQSMSFQNGKVVGVGRHDDVAMACWICDTAVRAGGFGFSFGDEEEEEAAEIPEEELTEIDKSMEKYAAENVKEEKKEDEPPAEQPHPAIQSVKVPEVPLMIPGYGYDGFGGNL